MAKEVVISTSKINSYGTRVLTDGISIDQYLKNPIILSNHHRPWGGNPNEVGIIGRMENLRFDGDRLIGTPVFNSKDPAAARIEQQFNDGFIHMVSAGLEILATSDEPADLLPGQRRATLTKTKLLEVSMVDIGANDDALALSYKGKRIDCSQGNQDLDFLNLKTEEIPNNSNNKPTNKKNKQMEELAKIALSLGLGVDATALEITARIAELQTSAKAGLELKAENERQVALAVEREVATAIADNRITADRREHFINMGKAIGLTGLQETLGMIAKPNKPTDGVTQTTAKLNGATLAAYTKYSDIPADKIAEFAAANPEEYAKLYKAEYGIDLPRN